MGALGGRSGSNHRQHGHPGNWFAVRTDPNQLQSTIAQLPWLVAVRLLKPCLGRMNGYSRLPNLLAAALLLYTIMRVQVQRSAQCQFCRFIFSVDALVCLQEYCHNIKYAAAARHRLGVPCADVLECWTSLVLASR